MGAAARARSFLFVPGSRPDRFAKAVDAGADCIILDLEDAVPPQDKASARDAVGQGLAGFTPAQLACTLVRINAADTSWHADDLRMLAGWTARGVGGVVVPKAETVDVLQSAAAALGEEAQLVPLIESLAGLDAVDLLGRTPQVVRLAFGHLDFQLDLGMRCSAEETELVPVRLALVAASRRAQLPAPVDGVTTDARNAERASSDARRGRDFGFGAKLCIHPDQVGVVNEAFSASAAEIAWARRVVDAARLHEAKAFSLDGRMVDLPVIRLAERILRAQDALPAPGTQPRT